jgi:hypothetical protein
MLPRPTVYGTWPRTSGGGERLSPVRPPCLGWLPAAATAAATAAAAILAVTTATTPAAAAATTAVAAATVATTAAATTVAAAGAVAAATRARGALAGLADVDRAALDLAAAELLDGSARLGVAAHLDEGEAARSARVAIEDDLHLDDVRATC